VRIEVDGWAWLPKDELTENQLGNLRSALTIQPRQTSPHQKKKPDKLKIYTEDDDRIGIPRAFFQKNQKAEHEIVNRTTDGYPMRDAVLASEFNGFTTGRDIYEEQNTAVSRLVEYFQAHAFTGGLLEAGTGVGKTVMGLRIAHALGRRTLVLVHKEFLQDQWMDRAEQFFPEMKIGIVRQSKCDFEGKDFVIGMNQSLARREYDAGFYRAFGLVISDENHRVSAKTWARIPPQFAARWRLGVSATLRRKDKTEAVFWNHFGDVQYRFQSKTVVPMVRRLTTRWRPRSVEKTGYTIAAKDLSISQAINQLAYDTMRNRGIADVVVKAVMKGRKVLVASERLEQLWEIYEFLRHATPIQGTTLEFVTGQRYTLDGDGNRIKNDRGEWKARKTTREQLKQAESAQVLLATIQMINEGFDVQSIDAEVLASPVGDAEQIVGRCRRECDPEPGKCERLCPWRAGECQGKQTPIIVDVLDVESKQIMRRWDQRWGFYKSIGAKIGGQG